MYYSLISLSLSLSLQTKGPPHLYRIADLQILYLHSREQQGTKCMAHERSIDVRMQKGEKKKARCKSRLIS